MGFGRGEASQGWTRNDGGGRRVGLRDSGEGGSPCWSPLGMDMGRCLDLGFGLVVPWRYGLYRERTELDASLCMLD